MPGKLVRILSGLLVTLMAQALVSSAAAQVSPKDRTVVVITVDGFPAWIWNDPTLPTPLLRQLATEGATAKAMTVSNPSVTWINHTTLVTGVPPAKHGVLFNGLLVRTGPDSPPRIEQWRDKKELVRVPTVYDLAHQAGLTTAQVDWIPTTNSGTFTWEFPERPNPDGAIETEMTKAGLVSREDLVEFNKRNPPWRDMIWTRAAVEIIKQHKPNLLYFHLLNTDSINHRYGPGTAPSLTAYAYADACIREVMEALTAAGLKDKATVLVVTDHGFKTAKRIIRPNIVLRQAGLLRAQGPVKINCDAYVIPEGGIAMVYVTDPKKRAELLPRLKEMFAPVEGIERILEAKDYPALGMPTPEQNDQMSDLVLVGKSGYAFTGSHLGDEAVTDVTADVYPGHHGYLNTDPQLDGVFIAWGYGIKPGVKLERVRNLDVAPTVAALLGLKLPNVDGRVLTEILQNGR